MLRLYLCGLMLLLGVSLLTACPSEGVRKGVAGKGGLPTNNLGTGTGTAGAAVTIPPEQLFPGAEEIEGRPFFFRTNTATPEVHAWILANIPGCAEIAEGKTKWKVFRGETWTIELHDDGGNGVLHYMRNDFLKPGS